MMFTHRGWLLVLASSLVCAGAIGPLVAKTLAGVHLPRFLQTEAGALELASCGVRRTLWIEHYVAALYVPRSAGPHTLRYADRPKAVRLHIVDGRYLPQEISEKWRHALESVLPERSMASVRRAYGMLRQGDVVTIVYVPARGVTIDLNETMVVHAPGHAAVDAVLEAWAERESISSKLDQLGSEHAC